MKLWILLFIVVITDADLFWFRQTQDPKLPNLLMSYDVDAHKFRSSSAPLGVTVAKVVDGFIYYVDLYGEVCKADLSWNKLQCYEGSPYINDISVDTTGSVLISTNPGDDCYTQGGITILNPPPNEPDFTVTKQNCPPFRCLLLTQNYVLFGRPVDTIRKVLRKNSSSITVQGGSSSSGCARHPTLVDHVFWRELHKTSELYTIYMTNLDTNENTVLVTGITTDPFDFVASKTHLYWNTFVAEHINIPPYVVNVMGIYRIPLNSRPPTHYEIVIQNISEIGDYFSYSKITISTHYNYVWLVLICILLVFICVLYYIFQKTHNTYEAIV
jgi:hypothetical protein